MVVPPLSLPDLEAGLVILAGLGLFGGALRALLLRRRSRQAGALVEIDRMDRSRPPLRSERYGIVGRPDELRRLPDGRIVPIEVKSRSTPPHGPPSSHRVQVEVYALLVEETTGVAPPFGLLRYSDGGEFRIPWNSQARQEVLEIRGAVRRPYDGAARPSPGRCRNCRYREHCDARAA
jgi:CRISPR-associated exonuclease Cas4